MINVDIDIDVNVIGNVILLWRLLQLLRHHDGAVVLMLIGKRSLHFRGQTQVVHAGTQRFDWPETLSFRVECLGHFSIGGVLVLGVSFVAEKDLDGT